jgi:hypothetical protein
VPSKPYKPTLSELNALNRKNHFYDYNNTVLKKGSFNLNCQTTTTTTKSNHQITNEFNKIQLNEGGSNDVYYCNSMEYANRILGTKKMYDAKRTREILSKMSNNGELICPIVGINGEITNIALTNSIPIPITSEYNNHPHHLHHHHHHPRNNNRNQDIENGNFYSSSSSSSFFKFYFIF